jgi:hypothetical protein
MTNDDASTGSGKADHYEDYDWKELSDEVKQAATALGYDKKMWDGDGKPKSEDKVCRFYLYLSLRINTQYLVELEIMS